MNGIRDELWPAVQAGSVDAHAGLWFDRYYAGDQGGTSQEDKLARAEFLKSIGAVRTSALYPEYFVRWLNSLNAIQDVSTYSARTTARAVIGIGNASAIETGCTLHHTYGVPYFPGSALKGICSHFARRRMAQIDGRWKQNNAYYEELFGSHAVGVELEAEHARSGCVDFLDALPVVSGNGSAFQLLPDVMTVHHFDYYASEDNPADPPADWDQPIPVSFLSFTGTFLVALRGDSDWCDIAAKILFKALAEEGIGAKTSSGYGRAELDNNSEPIKIFVPPGGFKNPEDEELDEEPAPTESVTRDEDPQPISVPASSEATAVQDDQVAAAPPEFDDVYVAEAISIDVMETESAATVEVAPFVDPPLADNVADAVQTEPTFREIMVPNVPITRKEWVTIVTNPNRKKRTAQVETDDHCVISCQFVPANYNKDDEAEVKVTRQNGIAVSAQF